MSLDPRETRIERELEELEKEERPKLNPPFPYRAVSFDFDAFPAGEPPPVDVAKN
jgi:hypothetical protein